MSDQTVTLVHSSPLGALEIPTAGIVPPGEPFTVDATLGARLLEQTDLYAPAKPTTKKDVAE